MEDYQQELKSVNHELKEIEKQLEDLLMRQSLLQERQAKLQAILDTQSSKKRQEADKQWDKTDFSWSQQLNNKLQSVFGMQELRPMQLQTMNATMSGRDCLLIMPTGGGKSLCFQLPAVISKGITLVVSPLISLMEDQIMSLEQFGVEAVMLNADADKATVKQTQDAMTDKHSTLKLIYVTPEKLAKSKRFMNRLEKMYEVGRFARLVIDEVHCCSQWGHDFRPDYKFLGIMKRQFPKVPILGLTATATLKVLDDIKTILNIPDCLLLRSSFNRPNLYYQVLPKAQSADGVLQDMTNIINTHFHKQSGIIYCFSQKESEEVAIGLQKRGIKSACYHANMPAKARSQVHHQWSANQIQVVVATVAFGMGIDKPDVRFVIHHSLSKSMENLYQESGRSDYHLPANPWLSCTKMVALMMDCAIATFIELVKQNSSIWDIKDPSYHDRNASCEAFLHIACATGITGRDGDKSHCILYYRFADVARQSTMVFTERTGLENLYGIVAYCIDVSRCRRSRFARHFGEVWDSTQCSGMCDHCDQSFNTKFFMDCVADISNKRDVTSVCKDVIKLLDHAVSTNQRVTAPKVLDAWFGKGATTLRVKEVKVPTVSRETAERILAHMLLEGYVKEDFHFTAYSTICYLVPGSQSKRLLSGSAQVSMEFVTKGRRSTAGCSKPSTSSSSSPSPAAGKTNQLLSTEKVKLKPVVINREHSHFSSHVDSSSSSGKRKAGTAEMSSASETKDLGDAVQKKRNVFNSKNIARDTPSIGKKRKLVINDDDDDDDDDDETEQHDKGSEEAMHQKISKEDNKDLEDLAFDDDSDLDEPKNKKGRASLEATQKAKGARSCESSSRQNFSSSEALMINGDSSDLNFNGAVLVSDSD